MIDAAKFRQVLGNYPTGVCAVTAMDKDEHPIVLVIGSFTSVSLDPPLVGFLPDRSSSTWPLIREAGQFCINVLSSKQTELCRQMAKPGPDKFAGVPFSPSKLGAPKLEKVIAWIDCTLHDVLEAGDHYVVLGKVEHLEVDHEGDPMLFFRGRYGGFRELM
jgi:3-hydroxy-9,10-secoandrosta-1,3,5(10)-triene-9,17-dione monooxygenase reductase component